MNKLLEYGRKAIFYIRIMSGYEQRQIRAAKLHMEKHKQLMQAKKDAIEKIPEQFILSEIRQRVEEMQKLDKFFNDIEASAKEYFNPIDKEVEALMSMQMEKEKAKTEMFGEMCKEAVLEIAEKEGDKLAGMDDKAKREMMTAMFKQSLLENTKAKAAAELMDSQNQTKASSSSMS